MNEIRRKHLFFGLLSLILSVAFWVLICKFLFPLMDYRSVIPFATFEENSLPISLVPLILGMIALYRKEMKLMAIVGTVISSLTCLWLLFLIVTNGM